LAAKTVKGVNSLLRRDWSRSSTLPRQRRELRLVRHLV